MGEVRGKSWCETGPAVDHAGVRKPETKSAIGTRSRNRYPVLTMTQTQRYSAVAVFFPERTHSPLGGGTGLIEQPTEPLARQESALGELPTPATATPGQRKCLNELWFDESLGGSRL